MAPQPLTSQQIPDHAILDYFNKQTYLGTQYVCSIPSTTIATTSETPILLLSNPSVTTSAFPSGWKALFVNLKRLTCLTSAQEASFRFYFNPVITSNGTVQAPINLRPASPNTSIASIYFNPTATAFGTFVSSISSVYGNPSLSQVMSIHDPGQSLLVTVQVSANNTVIASELGWFEM